MPQKEIGNRKGFQLLVVSGSDNTEVKLSESVVQNSQDCDWKGHDTDCMLIKLPEYTYHTNSKSNITDTRDVQVKENYHCKVPLR